MQADARARQAAVPHYSVRQLAEPLQVVDRPDEIDRIFREGFLLQLLDLRAPQTAYTASVEASTGWRMGQASPSAQACAICHVQAVAELVQGFP